jgi:hypothetical protein
VLLINNKIKWRNIKVSYLASSRSDIFLGSFIASTFQTLACFSDVNNQIQATSIIPEFNSRNGQYKIVAAFISGLKTQYNTIPKID